MRIDPKTFIFCTLERDKIRTGLELQAASLARTIARKRTHLSMQAGDKWRMESELDILETRAARVADLIAAFNPEPVTLGERLAPGCTCGAAAAGNFDRCRCD